MALTKGLISRAVLALLVLALLVGVVYEIRVLLQAERIERVVETADTTASTAKMTSYADAAPKMIFARAWALEQDGAVTDAIAAYRLLTHDRRLLPYWRAAAHYNMANMYLREALERRKTGERSTSRAAAQTAKAHYRAALRIRPQYWDARYNLETAKLLFPGRPAAMTGEKKEGKKKKNVWSRVRTPDRGAP